MSDALPRDEAPAKGGQIVDRELWRSAWLVRAQSRHEVRQDAELHCYQLAAKRWRLASRQKQPRGPRTGAIAPSEAAARDPEAT